MDCFKNIYLFEHSPEALEAVKSGKATISTGGIRRIGDNGTGFLEQAKPALMSVADFQSLFEGKEHADDTDKRINQLENQLALSAEGIKEIQNIGWLNNTTLQRTYTLTYEGFKQTLVGLKYVSEQVIGLDQYVHARDEKNLLETTQKYINYLKTDAGNLRSKKYSVVNSNIAEHLDQISAFIKRILSDIESKDDTFTAMQVITNLLSPFAYVVRQYSALYYYENDGELLPGNYAEWEDSIALVGQSKTFRDKLFYYIRLQTDLPFRDKVALKTSMTCLPAKLVSGIQFDRHYIEHHNKQDYISLYSQISKKIESKEYDEVDGDIVIFLDNEKEDKQ